MKHNHMMVGKYAHGIHDDIIGKGPVTAEEEMLASPQKTI